jgi:hypothetical protein
MAGKGKGCLLQAKTRLELKDSRRPRGDATLQGVHGTTIRGLDTTERDSESCALVGWLAERPSQIPAMVQEMAFKSGERSRPGCWGFVI